MDIEQIKVVPNSVGFIILVAAKAGSESKVRVDGMFLFLCSDATVNAHRGKIVTIVRLCFAKGASVGAFCEENRFKLDPTDYKDWRQERYRRLLLLQ